jgi:hypothetical protein
MVEVVDTNKEIAEPANNPANVLHAKVLLIVVVEAVKVVVGTTLKVCPELPPNVIEFPVVPVNNNTASPLVLDWKELETTASPLEIRIPCTNSI